MLTHEWKIGTRIKNKNMKRDIKIFILQIKYLLRNSFKDETMLNVSMPGTTNFWVVSMKKEISLIGFLCLIASPMLWALSTDRDQPMDIDANHAQFEQDKQVPGNTVIYLKGNVRMEQGSLKAQADDATVYRGDNRSKKNEAGDSKINRVLMQGKPAHLEQMQDNDGGLMTAQAYTIDYQVANDTVEFTGNVFIVQADRGEFRGERMVYNTKTGEMQSGDNRPESRVHIRMLPKKSNEASDKDKSAKDKNTRGEKPAKSDKH